MNRSGREGSRGLAEGGGIFYTEREGVRPPGGNATVLRHDYNGALWEEDRCPCGG